MSIDYGERERQFLETLKADTGRTLEEWMAAIAAQGLTQRNDIIDWLRRQNFMFSKASWLERIHNNGGQPIYADGGNSRAQARPRNQAPRSLSTPAPVAQNSATAAPRTPPPTASPEVPAASPAPTATVVPFPQRALTPTPSPTAPPPRPSAPPAAPATPPVASRSLGQSRGQTDPAALDALLARAKAFRPLAAYLIAEIRKAVPDVSVTAHDGFVGFRVHDKDFALIAISPKELRLALALKGSASEAALIPAKLPALQGPPAMTQMIILNDARQITPALLAAVTHAAAEK